MKDLEAIFVQEMFLDAYGTRLGGGEWLVGRQVSSPSKCGALEEKWSHKNVHTYDALLYDVLKAESML